MLETFPMDHMCPPSMEEKITVVKSHGVTAVLLVTAVIIMQITEGKAAKTLRLLPKHRNTGRYSGPAEMC